MLEGEQVEQGQPPARAANEQAIKQAALKLFSEKGFHSTSTRDITEAAGVSKGTLYWYWKSKEEVAFSLVSDMLDDFVQAIEAARDADSPAGERLAGLIGIVAEMYYQETDYLRLLWKFRADRHYIFSEEYKEKVTSYYVRIREAIEQMLDQAIRSGEFKPMDTKQMAFILLGITEGLEVEWLENEDFSMRDALPKVMGIMLEHMRKI
jgi:AcrR family transcriptional regulator